MCVWVCAYSVSVVVGSCVWVCVLYVCGGGGCVCVSCVWWVWVCAYGVGVVVGSCVCVCVCRMCLVVVVVCVRVNMHCLFFCYEIQGRTGL